MPRLSNMKDGLELVITFGLVLPQSCGHNAQELFYAGVLAILSYKKIVLEPVELNILKSLSDNWDRISILSYLILEQLIQD